jgi:hypothetical protein
VLAGQLLDDAGEARFAASDDVLATDMRNDDRLCVIHDEKPTEAAQLICSMGLRIDD